MRTPTMPMYHAVGADEEYVCRVGDEVWIMGVASYAIAKILHAEYWDRYGWDIEFIDPNDGYHHWKQEQDGGDLFRKQAAPGIAYTSTGERRLVDWYGTDVTDLFRKYGQPV